jgi:hypothetical protein
MKVTTNKEKRKTNEVDRKRILLLGLLLLLLL